MTLAIATELTAKCSQQEKIEQQVAELKIVLQHALEERARLPVLLVPSPQSMLRNKKPCKHVTIRKSSH